MEKRILNFNSKPGAGTIAAVISFCCRHGEIAGFVLREHHKPYNAELRAFLNVLRPWQVASEKTKVWPGPEIDGEFAEFITCRVSGHFAKVLLPFAPKFVNCRLREAPEDLCFLRKDGSPLFVSISHEGDGYFDVDGVELEALGAEEPALRKALSE